MKKRKLVPGDGWLYFKVYCHPSRANSMLADTLQPLLNGLEKEGEITQWFFVRYRDPAYHLRVRLCLTAGKAGSGHVLDRMSKKLGKLLQQGFVQDYQLAVYERELERYDSALIEEAEQVFCASSALVAAYLRRGPYIEQDYAYYALAYKGVNDILEAFGFKIAAKVSLLGHLYASFYREFGGGKKLKAALAAKFREISSVPGIFPEKETYVLPVRLRIVNLQRHFDECLQYLAVQAAVLSSTKKKQLVADLMHMHLNRLFTDQPRQQELVVYYCLWRQYKSFMARVNY